MSRMNISFGAANGKSKNVKMRPIALKKDEKLFLAVDFGSFDKPIGVVQDVKYSWKDRVRMFFGRKPKDLRVVTARLINL